MNVKIFTTGGSIDKTYSTRHSDFIVGEPMAGNMLRDANVNLTFEIESLFAKDSLDITDDDRALIVERVSVEATRHIIITHGTDTMAQTGQALQHITDKVIVLTGAMQPAAFKHTDATFNLGGAIAAVQILPAGVYLVMSGLVLKPDEAYKDMAKDQFDRRAMPR